MRARLLLAGEEASPAFASPRVLGVDVVSDGETSAPPTSPARPSTVLCVDLSSVGETKSRRSPGDRGRGAFTVTQTAKSPQAPTTPAKAHHAGSLPPLTGAVDAAALDRRHELGRAHTPRDPSSR